MTPPAELADELIEARNAFLVELGLLNRTQLADAGLVGDWGARELVAHLGFWAGHATEAIHVSEQGSVAEAEELAVDEINATVARVARETDLATVQRRESASVDALLERIRALDPALLGEPAPDGDTLEQAIREDGPKHYREHADDVRRAREEAARG
ncbi:MAG: maleylpyruvate isomerase N-terminal domain-containing protein [Candidatus Limnocylindria bacterium]